MLGSGIISKLQTAYTGLATTISGLTRLKLAHRVMVVVGLISEIILSVLQSAATLNPATWAVQTGMVLFDVNGMLISHIATLQGGVPTWRAVQLTVAIWGHLFVIYFGIKFFATIAEETFAGDNAPTLPEYFFIAVFVLAPVQMVAGLLAQGVQGDPLTFSKEIVPYSGVYEVFTNIDLWLQPLKEVVPNVGPLATGNETVIGGGTTGNESAVVIE